MKTYRMEVSECDCPEEYRAGEWVPYDVAKGLYEALEFYAAHENWKDIYAHGKIYPNGSYASHTPSACDNDRGQIAREAIGRKK